MKLAAWRTGGTPIAALVCAFFMLLFGAVSGRAAEVIRHFHSDIAVAQDGTLTVTEAIEVNVENIDIRHGIFRDFPLTFSDEGDRIRGVDFNLVSVTRDGRPEPYHTERINNGIRIYAGSADSYVSRGVHTYRFTYETGRQIGFLEAKDQLIWNITGNFWQFPILAADADITLPDQAHVDRIRTYTGGFGGSGSDATARVNGNRIHLEAKRAFSAGEGMTVHIEMPAGTIDKPTNAMLSRWWWRDNRNTLLGLVAALLVWGWYGWSWSKVGRDPPRGVMVPRWDAPEGISPALVNYIDNKGFSDSGWKAFSAASINLAVKGLLKLDDLDSTISMNLQKGGNPSKLPPGEAAIYDRVRIAGDDGFRISKSNGESVKNLGGSFTSAIEKEHRGKYYQFNAAYVVAGIALSVASFIMLFVLGGFTDDGIFMMIFPNVLAVVIGVFAGVFGRSLKGASLARKGITIVFVGGVGVVLLAFIGLLFAGTSSGLYSAGELPAVLAMSSIIIANVIFFFIMGAPTPLGSKMMDGIDGLRHYLTLAEKDRMNMAGAPQMSPQHFETLLPYAVALGVEKPWSDAFEDWLVAARPDEPYQPAWYSGSHYGSFSRGVGHLSSSMASTVRSTLPAPPPGSSSSSGGGFSGGGGGGGGGGGW